MKIISSEFVKSAVKPEGYPDSVLPEIAFAGRSNVGKSSLINNILNRKRLVKTSSTPGRTQLLNFFDINAEFTFVDLPGFGFAKVPKDIKKDWAAMIETYLKSRETLKGVIMLLDMRRFPVVKSDLEMISWLDEHEIPTVIVVTKADKLSRNKRGKQLQGIASELEMPPKDIITFSSKTGMGQDLLWQDINTLIGES